MSTQYSNGVRYGILMLPLAGLMFVVGPLMRGPFLDPNANAQGFMASASSPNFATAWLIILLSQVVVILGFIALYGALMNSRVSTSALVGMVLSVVGGALFLSLTGFMAFAAPVVAKLYLQGDKSVLDIALAGFFAGAVTSVLYPSGIIATLGSILLGVAIWRSGTLPKYAAPLIALSIPLAAFTPAFSYPLEMIGNAFMLVGGAWIAFQVWQGQAASASPKM